MFSYIRVLTIKTITKSVSIRRVEFSLCQRDEDARQLSPKIEVIFSVHRKNQDKCNEDNRAAHKDSDVFAGANQRAQATQHFETDFGQEHEEVHKVGHSNYSLNHG